MGDYIAIMRGECLLDQLSADDRSELQMRAAAIDPARTVRLDQVIAEARARQHRRVT